jgi:hypothetical protein
MKMEFLESGSPDCPLIRLYEFKLGEAQYLRRIVLSLSGSRTSSVPLHKKQGIQSIGGASSHLVEETRIKE